MGVEDNIDDQDLWRFLWRRHRRDEAGRQRHEVPFLSLNIYSPFSPHWQSHYQSYTQCSNNTVLFVSGDIIENMLTKAQEHSFAIDPLKRTLDSIVSTKQQTLIRKMMELSCLVLFWSIWENDIIVSSSVSSSCCEMWQKIIPLEWLFQRHVCIRKLGTNHLFIVILYFFCREKAR